MCGKQNKSSQGLARSARSQSMPVIIGLAEFLKKLFVGAALLWVLAGCGGSPPDILGVYWRLNIQFPPRDSDQLGSESTAGREALSVFIQPWDDDGIGDLDSIYLIQPEADLFWALDSGRWQSYSSSGILWIGSNQFSSGYLGKLPRGDYVLELYDKVGEKAQRFFSMQIADTGELAAQVTVPPRSDELLFLLPRDISLYSIIGYDVANQILFTDANYQSIISLRELKIRNDELEKVWLSFQFAKSSVFAQLGPYLVPRIGMDSGVETLPNDETADFDLPNVGTDGPTSRNNQDTTLPLDTNPAESTP